MGFWDGIAGGIFGAGASIYGTIQNNKNVNKSLEAQAAENQKNREWNLHLAEKQNAWNKEQWQRENAALLKATADERAYNSPSAQMARLKAAGLNPDLMYGQGGISNTSSASGVAASPQMTAGAPSSPMDWSSLAGKKTIGSAIMDSLTIAQMRANVKKTEAEAKEKGIEVDILGKYGLETAELNKEFVREQVNKLAVEAEGISYSNSVKELEHSFYQTFRNKIVENKLESLEASTKMTKNALKEDIETLTLRIAGVNAENSRLVRMSDFTTSEWRLVFDVVKELLSFLK